MKPALGRPRLRWSENPAHRDIYALWKQGYLLKEIAYQKGVFTQWVVQVRNRVAAELGESNQRPTVRHAPQAPA